MRAIIRNALIGATISSLLAGTLLIFVSHDVKGVLAIHSLAIHWVALEQLVTDILYMWCSATLGTIIYGALAIRLRIYGQGSHALRKWKNGLLTVLITIATSVIISTANRFVGVSTEIEAPLFVATGLAMVISDACAPTGSSTVRS